MNDIEVSGVGFGRLGGGDMGDGGIGRDGDGKSEVKEGFGVELFEKEWEYASGKR